MEALLPSVMFLEDWWKYGAHVHATTSNTHAIRISRVLKNMGIKNTDFMLALFDKELMHIDPFNPKHTNSQEIRERILLECRRNIWYFLREVQHVPATGGHSVPFEFHRGNIALVWCFYNDIDIGEVLPRQCGKTCATGSVFNHQLHFQGYNMALSMLTKDQSLLHDNVQRIKDLRDALPEFLIQKNARGLDKDAKEGLSYSATRCRLLCYVNSNNERDAYKLGRGSTTPVAFIDEIAYFNYIWITFPSLIPATIRAGEDAARYGMRHANIYTTTAGRPDTKTGAYAYDLFMSAAPFTESFYDARNKADLYDLVKKNSPRGKKMVYAAFSHRQLGKTDAWLRETVVRQNCTSPDDVDRDYLNIWKSGTESGVVPPKLLEKIGQSLLEPKWIDNYNNYLTRWYVHKEILDTKEYKQKPLVIAMDSSEQIGNDYTTCVFLDPTDMRVAATLRCNDANIIQLARCVVDYLIRFPNSVLIPETRSTGRAIIDYVIDELESRGINPWKRIYNSAIQCREEERFAHFDIWSETPNGINRKYFGYATSTGTGINSRNFLYKTVLLKALTLNHSRIHDDLLIKEISQLSVRNGRIDHSANGHDDLVISYMLASFFIFYGKNLHMYGIDKNDILSSITGNGEAINPAHLSEQRGIQQQISDLEDALIRCPPSELIRHSYLRRIQALKDYLDPKVVSADATPLTKMKMDESTKEQSNRPAVVSRMSIDTFSSLFR